MRVRYLVGAILFALPAPAQVPARWTLVPELRIGEEGDPNTELGDVRGVHVSKNGNILILDFKTQDIRVFSSAGKYLKTIGRKGSGPGEFLNANGFARAPDGSIWVNDPYNHRFSVRRDDGEYLRDVPSHLTSYGYVWDAQFDATGRLMNPVYVRTPGADPRGGSTAKLERRVMQTDRADTLLFPSCVPSTYQPAKTSWVVPTGRGTSYFGIPFLPREVSAVTARTAVWCAFGAEYTVVRIGAERGDTQVTVRGKSVPLPVTPQDREIALRRVKETVQQSGAPAPPYDEMPRVKPVITGLFTDELDRLWVRLTPEERTHTRYDVYDTNGRPLAAVDIPELIQAGLKPVIRGDEFYAVVPDADDVPHVVRYRIKVGQ